MSKEKKEIEYNLHHICPSSRWWLTNDVNCEMIRKTTHQALHTLFQNWIFPEQIVKLIDMSSKAIKPEIAEELIEVLNKRDMSDPQERYKEWCIRLPKKKTLYR